MFGYKRAMLKELNDIWSTLYKISDRLDKWEKNKKK